MNPKFTNAARLIGCIPGGIVAALLAQIFTWAALGFMLSVGMMGTIFTADDGELNALGQISRMIAANIVAGMVFVCAASRIAPRAATKVPLVAFWIGAVLAALTLFFSAIKGQWINFAGAVFFVLSLHSGLKAERNGREAWFAARDVAKG